MNCPQKMTMKACSFIAVVRDFHSKKGFTGVNGRNTEHSTGIGLYLGRRLCDKLALLIRADHLLFPNDFGTDFSVYRCQHPAAAGWCDCHNSYRASDMLFYQHMDFAKTFH